MKKIFFASIAALALVPTMAAAQPGPQQYQHNQQTQQRPGQQHPQAQQQAPHRGDVRDNRQDNRNNGRQQASWNYQTEVRDYNRQNPWRAAPFKYQKFKVGSRIQPAFYGRNYLVQNSTRFHWQSPRVNERWVRHYDDALLVNTRTGRVIQVQYNAFRHR